MHGCDALPPRHGSGHSELFKRILRNRGVWFGAPLGLAQTCAPGQGGWMRAPLRVQARSLIAAAAQTPAPHVLGP